MSRHLGGRILVATGDAIWSKPRHVTDPIRDGLRIVVVLDGSMTLDAGGTPRLEVEGPMSLEFVRDKWEPVIPKRQTKSKGPSV